MTLSWGDLAPSSRTEAEETVFPEAETRLAALALAIARRPDLWRPIVRHDPDLRWHSRLALLGDIEVWLLGWTSEQEVELHDHGGSSGAFAVAEGELRETYTESFDERGLRTASCSAGRARSFGATRIHHVTNHASARATSIHVYSPPLTTMSFYELAPGRVPTRTRVEHILDEQGVGEEHARPEVAAALAQQAEEPRR